MAWGRIATFVVAAVTVTAWTPREAFAGCNLSTQEIADCITVPRAPARASVYSHGGGGGGGVRYYGGGGGGGPDYGAALGAGAAILGVLGDMAEDEARREAARDREEAAREAARRAYCHDNWQQASSDIRTGNDVYNHWNPGGAIPYYERAISLLNRCGDAKNIAIARRNLNQARLQYAAIKDDNRVNDALDRYGPDNAYNKGGNPFGQGQGTPVRDAARTPAAAPGAIAAEAAKRCDYAQAGTPAWKTCMANQEGRAIMDGDPDIKSMCQIETSAAARNNCALKAYADRLAQKNANPSGNENCYWDEHGNPCYPGGGMAKTPADNHDSLRDRLRKALANTDPQDSTSGDDTSGTPNGAPAGGAPAAAAPQPDAQGAAKDQSPPDWNRDDPLQAYLHAPSANGGLNGGLGGTDFHMDADETRREMDRLEGTPAPGHGPIYGPPSPDDKTGQ